jgi:DNA helicase II / ATP-dependent DNA helicase PcrA
MQRPNAFPTDHGQALMLTSEQLAIVQRQAPSAIIAALAGTGKTTTLACAAVQHWRQHPDARILVLASSKAGVQAFQHRLQMLVQHVPNVLHITTLERWCARSLRQRDAAVRFVTDSLELRNQAHQALHLLEEQLQRQPDARIELPTEVDMQAFSAFNRAAKKSLLLQRLREEGTDLAAFCEDHMLDLTQARLYIAYERLRIDDCGDVRYYAEGDCTYALAQDAPHTLNAPYDLVLFDEMHDLDLAALTVLRHILQASSARFLGAGDFNQHIEAQAWSVFQDQLHQLGDFLPQATQSLPLTKSRRFGPQIAKAVNHWFDVDMKAPSTRSSTVTHWTYDNDAQCMAQLLQAQASIAAPAVGQRPPLTVILRHAHDAVPLEWEIYRAGKSVSLHGLQPCYHHRDVALLLGLLYAHGMQAPDWKSSTCILSPETLRAFIDGALYFGKGRVNPDDADAQLNTMATQMHAHPQGIWRFLIGETNLQGGQRNFAAFGKFLALPLSLQSNAHALLKQADLWGLFAGTPMPQQEQARLRARIESFMLAIAGCSVAQVLQQVAEMAQRLQKTLRYGPSFDFQLLSIEQAKGQEFECVAVPFLEPGRFPAPAPKATAFLERNRLYVAMTRAKHRLWLLENAAHPIQGFKRSTGL